MIESFIITVTAVVVFFSSFFNVIFDFFNFIIGLFI